MSVIQLAEAVGALSVSITIFGTISNGLTLFISTRKDLRSIPTFIFIAFNSFIETITLYNRNLDSFNQFNMKYQIRNFNEILCKMNLFLHYFPLQTSAWLLVAMCIERFLSIRIKTWRKQIFKPGHALITSLTIVAFFFVGNFYINFSPQLISRKAVNSTTVQTRCIDGPLGTIWSTLNLYVYSIVPFFMILAVNCLLVFEVACKKTQYIKRSSKDQAKRRSLSLTIIILTLSFIIMSAPAAIAGGYFLNQLYTSIGNLSGVLLFFLSAIRFLNHCSSFIILILTNKKFSNEFKTLIKWKKQ